LSSFLYLFGHVIIITSLRKYLNKICHHVKYKDYKYSVAYCCLPLAWPRSLRRTSAAALLLELRVRIPPGAWISVSYEGCVLLCSGICVGLITHPEGPYRVWRSEESLAHLGLLWHGSKTRTLLCTPCIFKHYEYFYLNLKMNH
jgi:hypothetical protein